MVAPNPSAGRLPTQRPLWRACGGTLGERSCSPLAAAMCIKVHICGLSLRRLTISPRLAYNIYRPKMLVRKPRLTHKKRSPPELQLRGASLCLLALAVSVKPLADVVANYTCCDGHKDARENFQCRHLLSVARLEKGSTVSIPYKKAMVQLLHHGLLCLFRRLILPFFSP